MINEITSAVITAIKGMTDDMLSYMTFGAIVYLMVTDQISNVPEWFVPVIVLQAKHYWDSKTGN
jgi:hypothetical protein